MWQEVREELHPRGLEIVTVALDTGGIEAARPSIEAAKPEHPSLIDEAHVLGELFGVVNVPNGVWIDEQGMIVRPAEAAWPGRSASTEVVKKLRESIPADADEWVRGALEEAEKIPHDSGRYMKAVRDWVENGSSSRYAVSPEEVIERSGERDESRSLAAAHFELGQHLWRGGHQDDAVPHFREAHRLQPENWTYKRQAWSFVDPIQRNTHEVYGTDWLTDVRKIGAENYYRPLEL